MRVMMNSFRMIYLDWIRLMRCNKKKESKKELSIKKGNKKESKRSQNWEEKINLANQNIK